MAVVLIIETEDGQVSELPILSKVILGRSSSADFKISDPKMSGSHCSFEITPKGELILKDLDSSNGSFLNNGRIQNCRVQVKDIIRVGNTLIKIDGKQLSASERKTIGTNLNIRSEMKDLPEVPTQAGNTSETNHEKTTGKKKTVMLSNALKGKTKTDNNWLNPGENVLEQEESTGHTRLLKLDVTGKKKK